MNNTLHLPPLSTEETQGSIPAELTELCARMKVPFNPLKRGLYTPEELYEGYREGDPGSYIGCFDDRVYRHYLAHGKVATELSETMARTLHDYAIGHALRRLLSQYNERRVVGIMGGHALLRTDIVYQRIARLSKMLTEKGCLMVSGGGPGAMEATHLGAWMAGRTDTELGEALNIVAEAPSFKDAKWLDTAWQVRSRYPQSQYQSLGVPTWLYGHEPATPLATQIAKYFENALREDGILTIAMGGVVYAPGSAGTMQEIFQDTVQNHYLSFGYASPMIFLGEEYWQSTMPVYPLLRHLMKSGRYQNLLLSLTDDVEEIKKTLLKFIEEEE